MSGYVATRLVSLALTASGVVTSRLSSMALFMLTARLFSPHDNALFIYAITLPQLLIQLGTLGWLNTIRKEISRRDQLPADLFKGFFNRSLQIPTLAITVIGVVLVVFSFASDGREKYIYLCAAGITVAYGCCFILREYLAALGAPALGIYAAETIPFGCSVLSIWLIQPASVETATLLFFCAVLIGCFIQIPLVLSRIRPYLSSPEPQYETAEWLKAGGFSLLGFGGRAILDRLDTIVLASLASAVPYALYNSAMRVTSLLMVVPMMLLPVFSTHLSIAFSTKNRAMLRKDMALQTVIVVMSVIPLVILLLTFPKEIMGFLFGEHYKASSPILSLIVFSQVLFALSLPWSNFLLMINKEHIYGFLHLLVICLVLPLAMVLAPDWGAFAVAIASLIANSILFAFFTLVGITHLIFTQNSAA